MNERWKPIASGAGLVLVALCLYCLWLWQPERQVLKHNEHFLKAAENRNRAKFAGFIDASYADRWNHDKGFIVREASEVLRQFFALTIRSESVECTMSDDHAAVTARIRIEGRGTAIAELARSETNALTEPWLFEWKRKSWKPWDWKLVRVDQTQLRLDRSFNLD